MPPLPGIMNMESMACARCDDGFEPKAKIVNSNGELFHPKCFVCAQCFRPFPDGVFYEFEGRKYCEHDFHVLFAPCCAKCGEFIIGRVIKAMQSTWHPECFCCEMCGKELADLGFIKNQGRALCHECNNKDGQLDKNDLRGAFDNVGVLMSESELDGLL